MRKQVELWTSDLCKQGKSIVVYPGEVREVVVFGEMNDFLIFNLKNSNEVNQQEIGKGWLKYKENNWEEYPDREELVKAFLTTKGLEVENIKFANSHEEVEEDMYTFYACGSDVNCFEKLSNLQVSRIINVDNSIIEEDGKETFCIDKDTKRIKPNGKNTFITIYDIVDSEECLKVQYDLYQGSIEEGEIISKEEAEEILGG